MEKSVEALILFVLIEFPFCLSVIVFFHIKRIYEEKKEIEAA
jgi:hypothetical protein